MSESNVFCMDCMEGLRAFPDKFFDLAVVDPPYGINITGRHKNGALVGGGHGLILHSVPKCTEVGIGDTGGNSATGRKAKRLSAGSQNYITPLRTANHRMKHTSRSWSVSADGASSGAATSSRDSARQAA